MPKKYNCIICKYSTELHSNYKKHLTTKRHKDNKQKSDTLIMSKFDIGNTNFDMTMSKNDIIKPESIMVACEYCKKKLSRHNTIKRHYITCKEKIKSDIEENKNKIINEQSYLIKENTTNIKQKDNQIEEQIKQIQQTEELLEKVKEDYIELLQKVASNNIKTKKFITNGTLNAKFVLTHFPNATPIETLMDPPLTQEEIKLIKDNGPIAGCYELIKKRCVTDIAPHDQPFHCVDGTRIKFLTKTLKGWTIDYGGEAIIYRAFAKVREVFPTDVNIGSLVQIENMKKIFELETKGKRKIIKQLCKKTLLKNNVGLLGYKKKKK